MTKGQIKQIRNIINEHFHILMQLVTGESESSPILLKKFNLPKDFVDLITTAFKYGKFNIIDRKFSKTLSDAELNQIIKNVKLTSSQVKALEYTKMKTGQHITGLASDITSDIVPALVDSGLTQLQGVQAIVGAAMIDTRAKYSILQNLRDMSKDWERDWHRVAHTEMWNAKINGEVMAIMEGDSALSSKKGDAMVYKNPSALSCKQCRKLYLEANGKKPKLFKLSDMIALGTNVGLKTADWKPIVGTVHPNCSCTLSVMPEGFTFDDDGEPILQKRQEI